MDRHMAVSTLCRVRSWTGFAKIPFASAQVAAKWNLRSNPKPVLPNQDQTRIELTTNICRAAKVITVRSCVTMRWLPRFWSVVRMPRAYRKFASGSVSLSTLHCVASSILQNRTCQSALRTGLDKTLQPRWGRGSCRRNGCHIFCHCQHFSFNN